MEPVSPVVPGSEEFEVVYAKNDKNYKPLPVIRTENALLTRWTLNDEERQWIANGGDLFIVVMHFGDRLQPLKPIAGTPDEAMQVVIEAGAPL